MIPGIDPRCNDCAQICTRILLASGMRVKIPGLVLLGEGESPIAAQGGQS